MVIFSDRENNGQSVTRSTIMQKLSQILAILIYFLYSSVTEVAGFTMAFFSFDGARKALQNGYIFRWRK